MKVYIASTLSNAARVAWLRDRLAEHGVAVTYDWTTHGAVGALGREVLASIGKLELAGVREADAVVAILPGGRGTHVEIGAALALGKPVVIVDEPGGAFVEDDTTCAFYWVPGVCRVTGRMETDNDVREVLNGCETGYVCLGTAARNVSDEAFETATMLTKHAAKNASFYNGRARLQDLQKVYREGCCERGVKPDPLCLRTNEERKG